MTFIGKPTPVDPLRAAIRDAHLADESASVEALTAAARFTPGARDRIGHAAYRLVEGARSSDALTGGLDAFLHQYALSSHEGVVLMCLAEALLRIPDSETVDRLIRDKLPSGEWRNHLGQSDSVLVNASTWGLLLTGRIIELDDGEADLSGLLGRMVARSGEPIIRQAMMQAMRIMARQFVMGRTIDEALRRADDKANRRYRHSFDMLGEAALTAADAARYFAAYGAAIEAIGAARRDRSVEDAPGISVKLSALHPRYEFAQRGRVIAELAPALAALSRKAKSAGIGLTVDAEEADRLDLSLDLIEMMLSDPDLDGWDGFGLAVQAYQKRCAPLIDWLAETARGRRRRLMVRLVKGAYWDSEIKRAQELGLDGYPVFTRKVATDVSYIACARKLFAAGDVIFPQFATHNAHTIAAVIEIAGDAPFEFQRLHGMGEALYEQDLGPPGRDIPCRVYAPVGRHEDLLPYLVRRLLENGANTSFVNRLVDEKAPIAQLVADPIETLARIACKPHPRIPAPRDIFGDDRRAARGLELSDPAVVEPLAAEMSAAAKADWRAAPIVAGVVGEGPAREVIDPADRRRIVGHVVDASSSDVRRAIARARDAAPEWDAAGAETRAACLDAAADLYEANLADLMTLAVREAGKTIGDALGEVREAVDFCRYYAARARGDFARPTGLPGPAGEDNEIALHGRGVFACVSPWNFPLAIFTGQVAAALAAGNAVVAKPAEQTPLIAAAAVRLLHRAGVPEDVLHLVPGSGETVGAALVGDPGIDGVAFTGSTETARAINRQLAARTGAIVPLIAETGGQNAMIVDSSALPEQVVKDVITSAFGAAGQRCSALRALFLQDDVADRMIDMLIGAMAELRIGDPALLSTDVGPVIDRAAQAMLDGHAARMSGAGTALHRVSLGPDCANGCFVAPSAFEIDGIGVLEREVFGPMLHVIRYSADRLDDVLEAVRNTGYGLTLGIHSRIDSTIRRIHAAMPVGNVYVNRNMVGAVVGVHPFGGERLSGTGPKAGGPRYLHRFAVERTLSVNTVAMGGNASLLSLTDDETA